MDHAAAVRIGQRVGHALGDAGGLRRLGPPAVAQQVAQVAALQPLHRNVDTLLRQPGVVDGDDVRVVQPRSGSGLGQQLRFERVALRGGDIEMQGLHRDRPRQQRVECGMHGAQAAGTELVLQGVAADMADRRQRLQRPLVDRHGAGQRLGVIAVGQLFGDGDGEGIVVFARRCRARGVIGGGGSHDRASLSVCRVRPG